MAKALDFCYDDGISFALSGVCTKHRSRDYDHPTPKACQSATGAWHCTLKAPDHSKEKSLWCGIAGVLRGLCWTRAGDSIDGNDGELLSKPLFHITDLFV